MSEIKPHSCSAEAIAQEIADNTPHGKKTDTYARIYQGAYFGAVRAFEESSASLNRASDACASVQKERDELREMLGEAVAWFERVRPATDEATDYLNDDGWDDMADLHDRLVAFLARYEGGR